MKNKSPTRCIILIGLATILAAVALAVNYGAPLNPLDEQDVRSVLFGLDRDCTAAERYLYNSGIDLEYFGLHSMREDLQGSGEEELRCVKKKMAVGSR